MEGLVVLATFNAKSVLNSQIFVVNAGLVVTPYESSTRSNSQSISMGGGLTSNRSGRVANASPRTD